LPLNESGHTPFLCGRQMVLLYASPVIRSERKQHAPTCGPRSAHVLQCLARLPSRILRSPLHPTRCYPYHSHLRLDYVCCHRPLPPPARSLAPPLIPPLSLLPSLSLFPTGSSFSHLACLLSFSLHQLRGRGDPPGEALSVTASDGFEPVGVLWRWIWVVPWR
jgi:hypothetical protein